MKTTRTGVVVESRTFLRICHDHNLYEGTERFFKPNYVANIVSSWIPSLDRGKVEEKLKRGGAIVADNCLS